VPFLKKIWDTYNSQKHGSPLNAAGSSKGMPSITFDQRRGTDRLWSANRPKGCILRFVEIVSPQVEFTCHRSPDRIDTQKTTAIGPHLCSIIGTVRLNDSEHDYKLDSCFDSGQPFGMIIKIQIIPQESDYGSGFLFYNRRHNCSMNRPIIVHSDRP